MLLRVQYVYDDRKKMLRVKEESYIYNGGGMRLPGTDGRVACLLTPSRHTLSCVSEYERIQVFIQECGI
jgi:hypothetical protein